jgi:acyl-CoA thioesterase FadM
MAWAAIAVGGRWAVTGETTTRFEQPAFVGGRYQVTARLDRAEGDAKLLAAAEITNGAGEVCARAHSTLVVLGEAQAAEAAGVGAGQLDPTHHRTP